MKHHESIPLTFWPLGERLVSLVLSALIGVAAGAAAYFETAIFVQLVFAAITIAATTAAREDLADLIDAVKQRGVLNAMYRAC